MSTIEQSSLEPSGEYHSVRAAIFCLLAAGLATLVAFTNHAYVYALVAIMCLVVIAPAWYSWSRDRLDYFEPIHILGAIWFVYFGLGAVWTVNDPSYIAYDLYIVPFVPRATLYCLLGLIAMLIGYYGPWHREGTRPVYSEWPNGTLLPLIVGGLGFLGQLSSAASIRAQDGGGRLSVAVSTLAQLSPLFIFVWAMLWLIFFSGRITSAQRGVLFGVMVPCVVVIAYVTVSDKSLLMTLIGIPIVCRWYARHRVPWSLLLVLLLLLIFVVFPLYNTFRTQDPRLDQNQRLVETYRTVERWDSATFHQFSLRNFIRRLSMINSVAVVVRDVGRWVPFAYGETILLPTVAFFIPRIAWSDKPLLKSGQQFGRIFRVTDRRTRATHIGATIPGELYWNFDLPGIVFGMALIGVVVRWIYRRYGEFRGTVNPVMQAIYILLLVDLAHITGGVLAPAIAGVGRELILLEGLRWVGHQGGLLESRPESPASE